MSKINKKIIFTSGGTGGHIFPTIGIMEHFLKKKYEVMMITDLRGEKYLGNIQQIKYHTLNTSTPTNKKIYEKFLTYIQIFLSIIKSIFILKKEKPNLVFGLGGYVSFPVSIAAKILNIPLVIYENNLVIGRTNKYLLPLAKKLLIATDVVKNCPEKYQRKINKVGHILREDIINFKTSVENNYFSILVLGGSQGAKIFGTIIPKAIQRMDEINLKVKIYHQCTKDQKELLINFYEKNKIDNVVFEFNENIIKYLSIADLAICRCGASTTAELVYLQKPFIAVPYPHALDDHQFLNAKYYEDKGYCWTLEQNNFNAETLSNLIKKIIKDKDILNKTKKNMKKINKYYTSENIENIINKLIN